MNSNVLEADPYVLLSLFGLVAVIIYACFVFHTREKSVARKPEKEQLRVVDTPQKETYGLTGTDYEHMRAIELVENQAYFTRLAFTCVEAGNCKEAKVFLDAALALSSKAKENLDDEAQHKNSR